MVDSALDAYMDAWDAHVQKVARCETTWGDDQIEAARIGVRAALNRAIGNAQADGWSPMNTAPQDGTRVLLWAEGKCRVGYWVYFPADAKNPCAPTHWMPLPAPPADRRTPERTE